jgi:hypothetical protein
MLQSFDRSMDRELKIYRLLLEHRHRMFERDHVEESEGVLREDMGQERKARGSGRR